MKKFLCCFFSVLIVLTLSACKTNSITTVQTPIKIKALVLPKFELDEMSGDVAGEAQYYYEGYLDGSDEYEISGGYEGHKLYVKNGVALYVLGMGKVNAIISLNAVLSDKRFDFSETYVISTGCGGSAVGYGTMGDVYVITAAVDSDLGHHVDARDLTDSEQIYTWYHDADYDSSAFCLLDQNLISKVYELTKNIRLETTEKTRAALSEEYDGAEWAVRDPQVLCGTTLTGDNYWKGYYDHVNALLQVATYPCPDPYAITEMEDIALALYAKRNGFLNRFIVLRDSVNTDVFMSDSTPESLWSVQTDESGLEEERFDIFDIAMKNNFRVGKVVIDNILNGTL